MRGKGVGPSLTLRLHCRPLRAAGSGNAVRAMAWHAARALRHRPRERAPAVEAVHAACKCQEQVERAGIGWRLAVRLGQMCGQDGL